MSDMCPEHPEERKLYCYTCVQMLQASSHAVGKVEGSKEMLEKVIIFVEKKLRRPAPLRFDDNRIITLVECLEALRKPEGGG